MTAAKSTRGFRNNNPLNLRISKSKWQGKLALDKNTDGVFEQFINMEMGIRAGMLNAKTQISRGADTLEKLVKVWAPANENDTDGYVRFVGNVTGLSIKTKINSLNFPMIINAMIRQENGIALPASETQAVFDKYVKSID